MAELLTSAQMRSIEQAAIESGEVTGLELMERAGKGVVEAIFEEWPELAEAPKRAVVLCGPGNNGGDGFVIARLLKERGWEVEVLLYGDAEKLPPDARTNYDRWCKLGSVSMLVGNSNPNLHPPDLFVDALFGTGLVRSVEGQLGSFLRSVEDLCQFGVRRVAVDIPSGICSDSGKPLGSYFSADLTVSFHCAKLGHRISDGPLASGKKVVASIGLEDLASSRSKAEALSADIVRSAKPCRMDKWVGSNKFRNGHSLVCSGGRARTGAARLAARAALRVGAGLVTVASPSDALAENAAQLTAIMLREVDDARALGETLQDQRINALCLGPGMGLTEDKAAMIGVALEAKRATVLDADALTLISRHSALFEALHKNCVLTPHSGEFARLFPDIAEKLNAVPTKGQAYSKVDATREAAKRAGCMVLFKGPDTVIAAPDGRCSVNSAHYERAAPWLATAGSGDVLAGFITGLLARGFSPMQAAETGAWLHVECALEFGPGLIAEDLPEMLPAVFRKLGL
ncbi:NAD(P)H-hydrate dehydratase [Actibacterium pelagium]|uniref:Bifunctional NAD(P)H-hydrate repair enzyme n=1 Tax=Actibacterium pelagium TaxID=2029103 RepID=A0A917EIU1_9RHOB|nr:NAD(P)H-hydrate dehydratase [Actibacterium pelagium]GGE40397.1 bifunctional NAD(P)H-hydrate repair enzyme [Actibacterium pelagium]